MAADRALLRCAAPGYEADGPVHPSGVRRLDAVAPARRAAPVSQHGHRSRATSALDALRPRDAALQPGIDVADLCGAALETSAAVESATVPGGPGSSGVRDGGELYDEHELAVVQRREHDVVFLAND